MMSNDDKMGRQSDLMFNCLHFVSSSDASRQPSEFYNIDIILTRKYTTQINTLLSVLSYHVKSRLFLYAMTPSIASIVKVRPLLKQLPSCPGGGGECQGQDTDCSYTGEHKL